MKYDYIEMLNQRIVALAAANARLEGELAEAVKISQAQNDKYFAERRAHIETSRRAEQAEADAAFWEKEARRENTLRHTAEAERDALRAEVARKTKALEYLEKYSCPPAPNGMVTVQCSVCRYEFQHADDCPVVKARAALERDKGEK